MGIKEAVPLLLTAVKAGKLTIGDIVSKFHDNPAKIFNLPKQDAQVVLDLDRFATVEPVYPEFSKLRLRGAVERVSFHNETVVLDGSVLSQIALGKNEVVPRSRFGSTAGIPESPRLGNKRVSFSSDMRRPSLAPETPEPQPAIFEKLGSELVSQPIAGSLGEIAALSDYIRHNNTFLRNNIISVKDITRSDLHSLFTVAQEMRLAVERQGVLDLLQGRVWPPCSMNHLQELPLHLMLLCKDWVVELLLLIMVHLQLKREKLYKIPLELCHVIPTLLY